MKKKKILRVFEGFAGYGGASFAFNRINKKNLPFQFEVIGYSEIDKYASELYDLNHKDKHGDPIKNYGDITKIDPKSKDFPNFDLFTGGFPCQPFSSAGLGLGVNDPYGRGTLFHQILRICAIKKPKFILLENVKGILSKKFEKTRHEMNQMLRELGYVKNKNDVSEDALFMTTLNSKNYGIPQNRERVWMFARLGGLPNGFNLTPKPINSSLRLKDFLDDKDLVQSEMYLSYQQIAHLKVKHRIKSFIVDEPLCFDVYNKKIKTDGYAITITMPEHNSLRVIESNPQKEIVRKMTIAEQFRLMGLEGLNSKKRNPDINFGNQSYTQLSRRAGNGWDVNLVRILIEHIFNQLIQ
jgi:DNA (cytosine-5)-methyltransferase 1